MSGEVPAPWSVFHWVLKVDNLEPHGEEGNFQLSQKSGWAKAVKVCTGHGVHLSWERKVVKGGNLCHHKVAQGWNID